MIIEAEKDKPGSLPKIRSVVSLDEIQKGTEGMMDVSDDSSFMRVLKQTSRNRQEFQIRSISHVPSLGLARRLDAMGIEHPAVGSQRIIFVSRSR